MKSLLRKETKALASIKTNPRSFYRYAKKFSKSRCRVGPLKHPCGSLTSDPLAMSNLLQGQFESVFSDPNSTLKKDPQFREASSSISSINFDAKSISDAIDEMDISSSAGEDGFPSSLLKNCNESLSYPLYLLWKNSFESSDIPSELKSQLIVPVFKKGSKVSLPFQEQTF